MYTRARVRTHIHIHPRQPQLFDEVHARSVLRATSKSVIGGEGAAIGKHADYGQRQEGALRKSTDNRQVGTDTVSSLLDAVL